MLAVLGIIPLLVLIYARPQEHFDALQQVPLLYLSCAFAVFGLIIDWRLRLSRPVLSPQAPWTALVTAWLVAGAVAKLPATMLVPEVAGALVIVTLFFVLSQGVDTLRGLRAVGAGIAAICCFLVAIGVHQGLAPNGCILLDQANFEALQQGHFDGRPCQTATECYEGPDVPPGADYECEHVGLLGTTSIQQRVRYRGKLQDPNELAVAVSCALPILLALGAGQRRKMWRVFAAVTTVGAFVLLVMTRSRTGQLAFCAVLAVYMIRRFGWRGVAIAAALALPAILLGGRSGAEADESGAFRLESWAAGFDMIRQSPVLGVGKGMFVENHFLTAHNSFVLAAAELGLVGYFAWCVLLYVSVKIAVSAMVSLERIPEAAVARAWALGIFASMVGLLISMLFLSLTFHPVTWVHLALCGTLHGVVRRHEPTWRVRIGPWDLAAVAMAAFGLLAATAVYLRLKGY